jgi:hypothetical protein
MSTKVVCFQRIFGQWCSATKSSSMGLTFKIVHILSPYALSGFKLYNCHFHWEGIVCDAFNKRPVGCKLPYDATGSSTSIEFNR